MRRVHEAPSRNLLITSDDVAGCKQPSVRQRAGNDACLARLKTLVSMAAQRPKVRRKTKPTRASKERRLDTKKREGERKRQRRGFD